MNVRFVVVAAVPVGDHNIVLIPSADVGDDLGYVAAGNVAVLLLLAEKMVLVYHFV